MKKKLLSSLLIIVAFTTISIAQTKVWDFGNDTATWPASAGIGNDPIIVDNLGLYPIATNTNFGAITSNNATFSDGFTATQRFQMNGAGYPSGAFQAMPTQRYLFVDVSGPCTVKVWFKTGSNGAVRTMYVSDGTAAVGSESTNTGANGDFGILTANYTGAAGRLYIYGDTACNLYKASVTGATVNTTLLSSDKFQNVITASAFAVNNQVHLSNITSETNVNVYSLTGQLVKSLNTSTDTNFELNKGFYIVNMESTEGKKSVKIIL